MEQPERTSVAREADRIHQATASDARRRALVAGCIGNLVEWYDFAIYGAFATILATAFFPEADPVSGLLAAFAVFGVAFLARPAGALLFAHHGDRRGRRRALSASILLMAVVTAGIGLLPGYGSIGWLAPALLVLLRAGQGVAVGGEYGGSAAFVIEYAPADRRGWYGGWQWAIVALGLAAGIATAALLGAG
jgi:MHS family proline/betaine transporter-like MFS transporter